MTSLPYRGSSPLFSAALGAQGLPTLYDCGTEKSELPKPIEDKHCPFKAQHSYFVRI
jgi:hypothetical protein